LTLRVSDQGGDPVTEQELTRRATRRLAVLRHAEEITGNVALTCRYYGMRPMNRRQMSTDPMGSAVPYTMSVGCVIPATSASWSTKPGT
jgi:hypothetical protein